MRSFRHTYLLFAPALVALAGSVAGQNPPKLVTVPVRLSGTIDGAALFREHCAVCHGVDGRGGGPAAPALKRSPGDLTMMAARNGGKFPALAAQQKIRDGSVVEHGSVDMPVWGKLLQPAGGTKNDAELRLNGLLQYLEKIQAR